MLEPAGRMIPSTKPDGTTVAKCRMHGRPPASLANGRGSRANWVDWWSSWQAQPSRFAETRNCMSQKIGQTSGASFCLEPLEERQLLSVGWAATARVINQDLAAKAFKKITGK